MSSLSRAWGGVLCLLLVVVPATAGAQTDEQRTEARERFDRALTLFNTGDDGGALAEFQRAYALVPHPLVLFNIASVYSAMGRAVESLKAYDELLANPGALEPGKLSQARARRAEQNARIATLEVRTNVDGAVIDVDGVERAHGRQATIRINSGTRMVSVVAPGHSPLRREVTVAGQRTQRLEFELKPIQGRLGSVAVQTDTPDLEVVLDGVVVGKTPLTSPLAVAPGQHQMELRRAGYRTERQSFQLTDAAQVALRFAPVPDPSQPGRGALALTISESEAVVFVNNAPKGAYSSAFTLPAGRHHLRVERAGFFPFERVVEVSSSGSTSVDVVLEPTADFRAGYRDSASSARFVGWLVLGTGAAVLAGSAGFLIWNQGRLDGAQRKIDESLALRDPGGRCEKPGTAEDQAFCTEAQVRGQSAADDKDAANSRAVVGWSALGVGAIGAGLGAVLLFSADDPDRYEPKPESDVFGSLRPRVLVAPQSASLGISGSF